MAQDTAAIRFALGTYSGSLFGLEVTGQLEAKDDADAFEEDDSGKNANESSVNLPASLFNDSQSHYSFLSSRPTMKTVFRSDSSVGAVKSLAASPDGTWLVSGGQDEIIRSVLVQMIVRIPGLCSIYNLSKLRDFGNQHQGNRYLSNRT
jgi:WD40 repeat protein